MFKTVQVASISREPTWGKIHVEMESGERVDVVGKWPCLPDHITTGMRFKARLEKDTSFKRKVQYNIQEIMPMDPGLFALTNQLAKQDLSHYVLQKMLREQPDLYKYFKENSRQLFFEGLSEDEISVVQKAYNRVQGMVRLQARFPFLSSVLCAEIGEHIVDQVEDLPYILTEGNHSKEALETADSIAKFQKMDIKSSERITAHVTHVMRTLFNREKHYWFDKNYVIQKVIAALSDEKNVWPIRLGVNDIQKCLEDCTVSESSNFVCLQEHYNEEVELARQINKVVDCNSYSEDDLIGEIDDELDEDQKRAVMSALHTSTIIRGGAGVGKTKVIQEIIRLFEMNNIPYRVMAPTGKASVRISEGLKGTTATTVHKAIADGKKQRELFFKYQNDEEFRKQMNYKEPDNICEEVVIGDEISMLAPHLLLKLLKTLKVVRLILVGDDNQLPSIESGCLLRDLIRSNVMADVCLKTIHRQKGGSLIATRSHEIIDGIAASWEELNDDIFSLKFSTSVLSDAVEKVRLLHNVGKSVQLIVMTNRSAIEGNIKLQDVFNPTSSNKKFDRKERAPWRENDNVINLENYYEDSHLVVCNGALGKIVHLDIKKDVKKSKVHVVFENQAKRQFTPGTTELGHSYALTVHKYQGSEIDCVVFAMDYVPSMSTKEMIYTAVTRAKNECHIFAPKEMWRLGCTKNEGVRETRLMERLCENAKKQKKN